MKTQLRIPENSSNVEVNCARVDRKPKYTQLFEVKKVWNSRKSEERKERNMAE
jgi:hypothetical protein